MKRRYYSSRKAPPSITLDDLYWKFQHLYLFFLKKDYFKKNNGMTKTHFPEEFKSKAAIVLSFQPFPITKWSEAEITEDHIFEVIKFLYDHVSKPGQMESMISDSGWSYNDYASYDDKLGRAEFREAANAFLSDYPPGYELTEQGDVLALGSHGLQNILDAEIIPYDEANVDSKVRNAIIKWRNRHLDLSEKKDAIRELADVFEWLKKTKGLSTVLDGKDESMLFNLANNFAIRHHNPGQKSNYDKNIWYSWMFHFYLATYHAAIRLLIKKEKSRARV